VIPGLRDVVDDQDLDAIGHRSLGACAATS
jgi:hypothetical protein